MDPKSLLTVFAVVLCTIGLYGQNLITAERSGLGVAITLDDIPHQQAVWVNFEITNQTDSVLRFPYKYYWDFPLGMSARLDRKNGKSLIRFGSRHMLSSELISEEQLKGDHVELEPGTSLKGTVNILDMVIMKKHYGDITLRPGKYIVGISFLGNESNPLDVTIPRE